MQTEHGISENLKKIREKDSESLGSLKMKNILENKLKALRTGLEF